MVGKLNKLLVLLCILVIPVIVQAAQVSLTVSVDKIEATVNDTIVLTISVEGTRSAPRPVVPAVNGLNIQYSGSSSEVKIINSAMSSRVRHNYIIFPEKEGSFTVGPAYIDYKGQRIRSKPVRLKILSVESQPQGAKPLFLKAKVSNTTPYYNEQVLYTLQFGRMVDVTNASLDGLQFQDFWVEDLGEQKQYRRLIGGQNYIITEIKKALFPTKAGKLTIDPATIRCEVILKTNNRRSRGRSFNNFFGDSFFSHRTKSQILHSEPIELKVKPLPAQGKPPNFYPLVGQLGLKGSSSKHTLEVGDSTTLTIEVSGNVNIRDAQLLNPANLADFKIYDDKPSIDIIREIDGVIGYKIFKKAIVPQKAGRLTIPSFEVPYFDPKTATYKLARSPAVNLKVSPAAEKEYLHEAILPKGLMQKEAIKILGSDILPVYTGTEALIFNRLKRQDYIIYLTVFMLPGLVFLVVFSIKLRQVRHEKDTSLLKKKNAYKKAVKNLGVTSSILKKGQETEFYAEISRIIKEYLGDKFNLPGAALTPQEAEAKLRAASQNGDIIERLKCLMHHLESCQFGSMTTEQAQCHTVLKDTKHILKQLEKTLG